MGNERKPKQQQQQQEGKGKRKTKSSPEKDVPPNENYSSTKASDTDGEDKLDGKDKSLIHTDNPSTDDNHSSSDDADAQGHKQHPTDPPAREPASKSEADLGVPHKRRSIHMDKKEAPGDRSKRTQRNRQPDGDRLGTPDEATKQIGTNDRNRREKIKTADFKQPPASTIGDALADYKWQLFAVVVLVVAVAVAYALCLYGRNQDSPVTACQQDKNITTVTRSFRSNSTADLPVQTDRFWRTMSVNLRNCVRQGSNPSCIILAVNENTGSALQCLARHLHCTMAACSNDTTIKGSGYKGEKRSQLDDVLSAWFNEGNRVAVISDIDEMSFDSAKMFYKYCDDNDNPTYPNTLLLLTIKYQPGEEVNDDWLELKLRSSWTDETDDITPILSRIANSLTVFNTTVGSSQPQCTV